MAEQSADLTLPGSPLAVAALEYVTKYATPVILNHSVRSFLFAMMYAEHNRIELGRELSVDLLFCATVLHDLGLTDHGNRNKRFEVDGADLAAEFLTEKGLPQVDVDDVWDAIALHTTFGIAEHKSLLCAVTHHGIETDFGLNSDFVSDETGEAIHREYPRQAMARSLVDIVVGQARANAAKAPPFTFVAGLVHQRSQPAGTTDMEAITHAARWGE